MVSLKIFISMLLIIFLLSGCDNRVGSINQNELKEFFAQNRVDSSSDYAVIKNGVSGGNYLMTIHGYSDNKNVCEMLIEPYNKDSSLSTLQGTYSCLKLN